MFRLPVHRISKHTQPREPPAQKPSPLRLPAKLTLFAVGAVFGAASAICLGYFIVTWCYESVFSWWHAPLGLIVIGLSCAFLVRNEWRRQQYVLAGASTAVTIVFFFLAIVTLLASINGML